MHILNMPSKVSVIFILTGFCFVFICSFFTFFERYFLFKILFYLNILYAIAFAFVIQFLNSAIFFSGSLSWIPIRRVAA